MQNTTTEMRECIGCKTTTPFENLEKKQKGVLFKTCMYCRKNDQDMKKILQKMYREDNIEQRRERRKAYDEANKEQYREENGLQTIPQGSNKRKTDGL